MRLPPVERLVAQDVPRGLLDDSQSLTGALFTLVEQFPDFQCLTILDRRGTERRIGLTELWEQARAIQGLLTSRGLQPGHIVILILPTSSELVAAYFGVMLAGGIPGLVATPSNRVAEPAVYGARIGAILANAEAFGLYCTPEIAPIFRGEGSALLVGATLFTPDDVEDAVEEGAAAAPIRMPESEEIATIQYSSGSTGTPKGILLSHRAMLNNLRGIRDGLNLHSSDVSVNWIPLYHDMGLIDAFLLPLLSGSPSVLIPTMDFMADPSIWLWAVDRYRGALSWSPNFAYSVCANRVSDADIEGLDLSSWRIAINAAEPVLAHTIEEFTKRFEPHGFRPEAMTPAWGLAETVTIATAHPIAEAPRVETIDRQVLAREGVAKLVSDGEEGISSTAVGQVLPHCRVEIRDPKSGELLPERGVGRVWLSTNSLFNEYHRAEEATAEVLVDGWLDSGDEGYLCGSDLFFVSRVKDLIIIGGEKYAPHDIETLINEVSGVRKGCVVTFGITSQARGTEEMAAIIETHETDAARHKEIERAARKKVLTVTGLSLRHVHIVPAGGVEKTTSGKLARRATRARYADRLPSSDP